MRSFICALTLVPALLACSAAAATDAGDALAAPGCSHQVRGVFWGGVQQLVLGQALAADPSPCAEYSVTVPPQAVRTNLGGSLRFDELRDLGIHPIAEIRWDSPTGWRAWVVGGHPQWMPGRTFYGAGVEARRRMVQRGLDVEAGETWAFNELTRDVRENVPGARAEVLEFLHGLYDGDVGMPKARGIVFNVFTPSTSDPAAVEAYKASVQAWLTDEAFWSELDSYVAVFANEVYPSPLSWGVSGYPVAKRARRLNDYLQHMATLAVAAPETVRAAPAFLRRTYMPLANAAWAHALVGGTHELTDVLMRHFVSTQVYALRQYAEAHPHAVPQDLIGFAWAPSATPPHYSDDGRDRIAARLANAVHLSTAEPPASFKDACGPPTERVWCEGEVEGAWFNTAWRTFEEWDRP
jgi:hypothetical protein